MNNQDTLKQACKAVIEVTEAFQGSNESMQLEQLRKFKSIHFVDDLSCVMALGVRFKTQHGNYVHLFYSFGSRELFYHVFENNSIFNFGEMLREVQGTRTLTAVKLYCTKVYNETMHFVEDFDRRDCSNERFIISKDGKETEYDLNVYIGKWQLEGSVFARKITNIG